MKFKELPLKKELHQALEKAGYDEPTAIQEQVLLPALEGKSIVGQSQTGTGKTAAFLLPILEKIDTRLRKPQALIIAPTRELVYQIKEEIRKLTEFLRLRSVTIYGGSSMGKQLENLEKGPQIIVATPGRLIDFIERRKIDTSAIDYLVLDEVDRMLDMGFIDDIKYIWDQLQNLKQVFTFSATINEEIRAIINSHIPEHTFIKATTELTVPKIDHSFMPIHINDKIHTLKKYIVGGDYKKVIIFTQTKLNTSLIARQLSDFGIKAGELHGDLRQYERMVALKAFKEGQVKTLVTTDVAARGLNMNNIELVINYDVPQDPESYIHRIGRTGRAGAEGKAIMFVSQEEVMYLANIEKTQKIKIKKTEEKPINEYGQDVNIELVHPRRPGGQGQRRYGSGRRGGGFSRGRSGFGGGHGRSNADRSYGSSAPRSFDRGSSSYGSGAPRSYDRGPNSYGGRSSEGNSRGGFGGRGRSEGGQSHSRPAGGSQRSHSSSAPRAHAPSRSRPIHSKGSR